jgi:hypothetical protein
MEEETDLGISLLFEDMGDNNIPFIMSIFPVVIYMDALKQKADIFKDNNKNSGIYR